MDWDKLRVFHAVAEAGSFTHAGEDLNLSQSAVSRQISALEESLSTTLFHRHARGLILTEQGELLYNTAHEVFGKLSLVEARLRDSKDSPSGDLRVTATVALGSTWLAPLMAEFMAKYPEIELHLILEDKELDLSMRQADIAIRLYPPHQPDLIQRPLFEAHSHLYAAPGYLDEYGTPATLNDLDQHRISIFGTDTRPPVPDLNWLETAGRETGKRRPSMSLNNIFAIRNVVEAGAGIAAIPDYMVEGREGLVRVLPDVAGPSFQAFFVYPEELRSTQRVNVFRDFLLEKVRASQF